MTKPVWTERREQLPLAGSRPAPRYRHIVRLDAALCLALVVAVAAIAA